MPATTPAGWGRDALALQVPALVDEVRVMLDRALESMPRGLRVEEIARLTRGLIVSAEDRAARGQLLDARGDLLRALFTLDADHARRRAAALRGRFAVIAGVLSNLAALEQVLVDITYQSVDGIVCLGNVIGPGPDPGECLERCLSMDVCLLGSYETEYLYGTAAPTTWSQYIDSQLDIEQRRRLRVELRRRCPETVVDGSWILSPGSPRWPLRDDIRPEDAEHDPAKLEGLFLAIKDVCLHAGSSNVPGVMERFVDGSRFRSPDEFGGTYHWTPFCGPVMVNVGSVGRPEDGDPRACWLLVDGTSMTWRRVAYDVECTAAKIRAERTFPDYWADRLHNGR